MLPFEHIELERDHLPRANGGNDVTPRIDELVGSKKRFGHRFRIEGDLNGLEILSSYFDGQAWHPQQELPPFLLRLVLDLESRNVRSGLAGQTGREPIEFGRLDPVIELCVGTGKKERNRWHASGR